MNINSYKLYLSKELEKKTDNVSANGLKKNEYINESDNIKLALDNKIIEEIKRNQFSNQNMALWNMLDNKAKADIIADYIEIEKNVDATTNIGHIKAKNIIFKRIRLGISLI